MKNGEINIRDPFVLVYDGKYYLYGTRGATCWGPADGFDVYVGTDLEHWDGPVTPEDWDCLDGTLYIEGEQAYLVFCHEHRQVIDGEMNWMALNSDLSAAGAPGLLFRASASPYVEPLENGHYITDGPFLYRCGNGALLMTWSSFGRAGYFQAVARSLSGSIKGPWVHDT